MILRELVEGERYSILVSFGAAENIGGEKLENICVSVQELIKEEYGISGTIMAGIEKPGPESPAEVPAESKADPVFTYFSRVEF